MLLSFEEVVSCDFHLSSRNKKNAQAGLLLVTLDMDLITAYSLLFALHTLTCLICIPADPLKYLPL